MKTTKNIHISALVALAAACLFAASASARNNDNLQLRVGSSLGFGGSPTVDSTISGSGLQTKKASFGMDLGVGLGVNLELIAPVHRYVLVGGTLSYNTWKIGAPGKEKRAHFVDIDVSAKARYLFWRERAELYVRVPIGMTVSTTPDGLGNSNMKGNATVGFNISAMAGVQAFFTSNFGAYFEIGVSHRSVTLESEGKVAATDRFGVISGYDATLEHSMGVTQFAMNIGVMYGF